MVIGDINIICVHQKIEVINRFTTAQVDPYLLTGNPEDFYYYWCRDYKLGTQEGMMYVIYPEGRFEDNYDKEYMDLQFESYDWNVDCPPEIVFIDDEFTEQLIQVLH